MLQIFITIRSLNQLTINCRGGYMTNPEVNLYTRQGCCLCDEAKAVLNRHGLAVQEIDIDADPQLRERYTDCVPVVTIDGKERFRGRVNETLLLRLIDHAS